MTSLVTTFRVTINGAKLPDDVAGLLDHVEVDLSSVDPDSFQLSFRDPDRVVLTKTGVQIGSTVGISVVSDAYSSGEPLLKAGEVTAFEAEFSPSGTFTVIRGFDGAHRLQRGRRVESYQNSTYADVVKKVVQRSGLRAGTIESTTPVYEHLVQPNVSDWDFLRQLAEEIGYQLSVVDKKVNFKKPTGATAAPALGKVAIEPAPLQLVKGVNLWRLQGVITAAEQVPQVEARGWDPKTKQAVVGTAAAESDSAQIKLKPADLAGKFRAPPHLVNSWPLENQAAANGAAGSASRHIGGTFAELTAVVPGDPKLRAGTAVSLSKVEPAFDGKYRITASRHVYSPDDGYTTHLTVSGSQPRTLLDLTSGGVPSTNGHHRISGVVPAIVTNANDPDQTGRVKVKFPWLSASYESGWARTVQPGAGNTRGWVVLPEVNDEVLVAFEQGDLRRPYVVGGLYNGKDKPGLTGNIAGTGQVAQRGFVSRTGHRLVFVDDTGKEAVQLESGDKSMSIKFTKAGQTVVLNSNGVVEIKGTREVKVSGANVSVEATNNLTLKGTQVAIQGTTKVEVKAAMIQLN